MFELGPVRREYIVHALRKVTNKAEETSATTILESRTEAKRPMDKTGIIFDARTERTAKRCYENILAP